MYSSAICRVDGANCLQQSAQPRISMAVTASKTFQAMDYVEKCYSDMGRNNQGENNQNRKAHTQFA